MIDKLAHWRIREPIGKIKDNYPFDGSYKKLLGQSNYYVFAITQYEGMQPKIVSQALSQLLAHIAQTSQSGHFQYKIIVGNKSFEYATFLEFTKTLIQHASNIQTPWYWDDIHGIIELGENSILIQPESDGMDIVIYISGKYSKETFFNLTSWFSKVN